MGLGLFRGAAAMRFWTAPTNCRSIGRMTDKNPVLQLRPQIAKLEKRLEDSSNVAESSHIDSPIEVTGAPICGQPAFQFNPQAFLSKVECNSVDEGIKTVTDCSTL
jgi:hypothetical protein